MLSRYVYLCYASFALMWLCLFAPSASAAPPDHNSILTYKNGLQIGKRDVYPVELRNAAVLLTSTFKEQLPSYGRLVSVAEGMSAKDRCFNLFSSRAALASVQSGMLDASANAESFLKNSIASIEEVNTRTQVTCKMQ